MGNFIKSRHKTLWHGDCEKFDTLKPVSIDFGNLFVKPGWSIFFWKNKQSAENWAVYKTLSPVMSKLNDNNRTHFMFSPKENITVVSEERYNKFIEIVKHIHSTAYVYKCEVPANQIYMGNDSAHKEYTVRMEISNFELNELKINANDVEKYIKIIPNSQIESELRHAFNLRGLIPSMLLINDFRYQLTQNINMIDTIYFENPPEPGDDLEKWMKNNQFKLKKYYPHERMKDYIKDKIEIAKNKNKLNIIIESSSSDDCETVIKSLNKEELDIVGCTDNDIIFKYPLKKSFADLKNEIKKKYKLI